MAITSKWRSLTTFATATAVLAVAVSCSTTDSGGATTNEDPDNGTTMTMWARNTSQNLAEVIVDEYNTTHENQINLTIIPNDAYQQKVAAAAASGDLPDLLGVDVIYSPNYIQQGLLQDLTDNVEALPFYSDLAPSSMEAASAEGKIYGTPFILDSSLILYNKTLFEAAGLDPEHAPENFDEIYEYSKAVREKVGGDTYGFYFGGNCHGCNAYTMFGYLAGAAQPPFTDQGTTANFNTPAMESTLELYKRLWDDGLVAPGAKNEDGATWNNLFNEGKIGILPRGTGNFVNLEDAPFEWGVAPLPAPDGSGSSAFVGGDIASITSSSENFEQAWNFLEWSLGDEAQVEVIAKNGSLPSRIDLANNEYSSANPNIVKAIEGLANGYTPSTVGYGSVIQNANGPWLKMVRDFIFNGDENAVETGQEAIQNGLNDLQ